jgi:hypothetical protein
MSDNPLWYIRWLAELDIKEARALYKEHFSRSIEDRAIEDELRQVLYKHDFGSGDVIAVPAPLVLAIVLRPRGKGVQKRPPIKEVERLRQRYRDYAVRLASRRWGAAPRRESKAEKDRIAEDVWKQCKSSVPSKSWLLKHMRRGARTG